MVVGHKMLLSEFTTYSMPSSTPGETSGGNTDGPTSKSSVISAWLSPLRKRKSRRKKKVDLFGVHYYPNKNETNIAYDTQKKQDGNIGWRRRYERHGLTQKSSTNRDRSELYDYVGHYSKR